MDQFSQKPTRRQRRAGLTTVEFALSASLLFMIFFVGIDFSRANMIRNTVNNAAFFGARDAVVPGATAASAEARAMQVLSIMSLNGATADCEPDVIDRFTEEVSMTVSVPMVQNSWVSMFCKNAVITKTISLNREDY